MNWIRRGLLAALALAGQLISLPTWAGDVYLETFRSPSLGRDYRYTIYLPDDYKKGERRYPVLYLLHGANGDENEWLAKGGLRETMDALIARQQIHPMVVVMPGHKLGWWVDSPADKAETALMKEVLPHVEQRYRVATERSGRLVAGLSAGGYGALNLVMKHPQLFAATAILSPAVYDPVPPNHSSAVRNPPFQRDGKFSPELWQSLNYVAHIDGYRKSGTIVPMYIVSGDHDTFSIALHSAALYEKLRLHQPSAIELRVVNGDHEWMVWRDTLPESLLYLNARITGPR